MKLLSYNLEKHKAAEELLELSESTNPDALCIQEAYVDNLPSKIGHLELKAATENNRLGLAVYVDTEKYDVLSSTTQSFKKTLHDRIAAPAAERLLAVKLQHRESLQEMSVASFHASPLTSMNNHRRLQISQSIKSIDKFGKDIPFIMAGDYNYPVGRKSLGNKLLQAGYDLTFSDKQTYRKYFIFRGHFDFITSRGFTIDRVKTLNQRNSDHYPILVNSAI